MSTRRVGILLPHTGVYPGLGGMLASELSKLGWLTTVRHRADEDLLGYDLLLLAGQCRNIDGLSQVLRKRRDKIPATILWQLEPLPPAQLSQQGEEIGLRVAAWHWGRMPLMARRVLNCIIPFRTRLMGLVHSGLARSYARQVVKEPDHQGWQRYCLQNYSAAMGEWLWIRSAYVNGWLDHCFASNQMRVRFLRSRGIKAEMLPVGYHPSWGRDWQLKRDIDVLFLGDIGIGLRGAVLRAVREQLGQHGRTLTLARGVYGEKRDELLSRSRTMLSVLRVPHDMAGMRVLLGLACGTLVISDLCDDTGAFQPGEHFVMAASERLPEVIEYYLTHEEERQKIARQGHRFVTEELTLAKGMRRMLAHVATDI